MRPDSHPLTAMRELTGASRADAGKAIPTIPLYGTSGIRRMPARPPLRADSTLGSCLAGGGVALPWRRVHQPLQALPRPFFNWIPRK